MLPQDTFCTKFNECLQLRALSGGRVGDGGWFCLPPFITGGLEMEINKYRINVPKQMGPERAEIVVYSCAALLDRECRNTHFFNSRRNGISSQRAENEDKTRYKKLKNARISKISFLDARYKWGLSSDAANTISCPFTAVIFSMMSDFKPIFHVFFL